uniref:Transposase IS701-like DDE domain-containing protein n=1 Tax=Solibacter usitatus (strain Ellin6076) TaxID=234267 RepID=Q025V0_SOLUE
MLLRAWLDITAGWLPAFPQQRSLRRAVRLALGTLCAFGRRTLSRAICAVGLQHVDWSAEYLLFARCRWYIDDLFQPILQKGLPFCSDAYVAVAMDDTRLHKTGRKIQSAFYQRDPLSPKFRVNLMFGLRFLQMSLLVPLYRGQQQSARALPVRFVEVPAVKKPGKKASPEEKLAWKQKTRELNLSTRSVEVARTLRTSLDAAGAADRILLLVGDNSFCNRTHFRAEWDRTELIVRARRDLKLCRRAPLGGPRFYDSTKFTPLDGYQDQSIVWKKAKIFHGGRWRMLRYKDVTNVFWQTGAGQKPLRLLVVAPIPYHVGGSKRRSHRDPAFLLTTDLRAPAGHLLQPYFDRWQIEVNHREEKDTLGVGQAQVRSLQSVPRQPAFAVAAYSALLLAGLLAYGADRTDDYEPLPKWRRGAKRPSCLDWLTVLRTEMAENPDLLQPFGIHPDWISLGKTAAA